MNRLRALKLYYVFHPSPTVLYNLQLMRNVPFYDRMPSHPTGDDDKLTRTTSKDF